MDPARLGADVRLLRRRKGWTQARLASEAHVQRWVISEIECGRGDRFPMRTVKPVIDALGGFLSVRVLFHGEALDRLRDAAHARLVEWLVGFLLALGWTVETEVTFNHFGERGSIDLLAYHPRLRAVLVIEVKTVVPDIGGLQMALDRKVRIAPELARARGWRVDSVSRLLVVAESSTARRRIAEHAATFAAAFPTRNEAVRRWLRRPDAAIRGLFFVSDAGAVSRKRRSEA